MAKDKQLRRGPLTAWISSDKAEGKKKEDRGGKEEKREGRKKSKYQNIKEIVLKWALKKKDPYSLLANILECNSYYFSKWHYYLSGPLFKRIFANTYISKDRGNIFFPPMWMQL